VLVQKELTILHYIMEMQDCHLCTLLVDEKSQEVIKRK
jgi:hypothetical protein